MSIERAVIIHGYAANPASHWFEWTAAQLRPHGVRTTTPALPESSDPVDADWQSAVRDALGAPDERTAIVAHSLGCLTALRVLRDTPGDWRLGSLVLVAGFLDPLPGFDALDTFIGDGADVSALAGRVDRITVIRSDDDEIVPAALTDRLAAALGTEAIVVPGKGHFIESLGVRELPQVVDAVLRR